MTPVRATTAGDVLKPSRGKIAVSLLSAALLAASGLVAVPASAAVPTAPDNIVVFPDRDFLGLEGYVRYANQSATIEVHRNGKVVGSTIGPIVDGDPALEVNHPGGVCWGQGTNLPVTPDIVPGDKIVVKVGGTEVGDTTVADAFVTEGAALAADGVTLTVKGRIASGVNRSQIEQRIVNPDLTSTVIGRRDVRALPGPLTRPARGGYSSGVTFEGETFTATYVFDSPAVASIAAGGGGERMMSWLEEDADANRQGLTIAEYGEHGGPGMGGCPAGPGDQQSPAPGTATVVRSGTSAQVKWTPAQAVPGAAAIVAYSVEAIAATSTNGERAMTGKRISNAGARGTTLTGLVATESYTFEVRSIDSAGTSGKAAVATAVTSTPPPDGNDNPAPTVTATPGSRSFTEPLQVSLASSGGGDIYWAKGASALEGDMPSDASALYGGPITIDGTKDVELHWAVFDRNGHYRAGSATYTYQAPEAPAPVPSAPTALTVRTDDAARTATATWSPPTTHADVVTGYEVYLDKRKLTRAGSSTATSELLTGLAYDTPYTVEVVAVGPNGNSTAASASFSLLSPDAGDPSAPQSVIATEGHQSATVTWAAPASSPNSTITRYEVQALDSNGQSVGPVTAVSATALLTTRVTGLTNGQPYRIRVTAVNTAGKTSSASSNEVTPRDVITVVVAEFRTDRNEWRVEGTSRAPGTSISVTALIGTSTVPLGTVTVQPDGSWAFRERNSTRRATQGTTVTAASTSPGTGAVAVTSPVIVRR
jgi:hypothetical protein